MKKEKLLGLLSDYYNTLEYRLDLFACEIDEGVLTEALKTLNTIHNDVAAARKLIIEYAAQLSDN